MTYAEIVAMLEEAGISYIMSTSSPELSGRFSRKCDSVTDELEKILNLSDQAACLL